TLSERRLILIPVRLALVLFPPSATPCGQDGMQNTSNCQREDDAAVQANELQAPILRSKEIPHGNPPPKLTFVRRSLAAGRRAAGIRPGTSRSRIWRSGRSASGYHRRRGRRP